MAADIDALWDYDRPALSETRFRDALKTESGDDALELQTQIGPEQRFPDLGRRIGVKHLQNTRPLVGGHFRRRGQALDRRLAISPLFLRQIPQDFPGFSPLGRIGRQGQ